MSEEQDSRILRMLTVVDLRLVLTAFMCIKSDAALDFEKFAHMANYTNASVAKTSWMRIKRTIRNALSEEMVSKIVQAAEAADEMTAAAAVSDLEKMNASEVGEEAGQEADQPKKKSKNKGKKKKKDLVDDGSIEDAGSNGKAEKKKKKKNSADKDDGVVTGDHGSDADVMGCVTAGEAGDGEVCAASKESNKKSKAAKKEKKRQKSDQGGHDLAGEVDVDIPAMNEDQIRTKKGKKPKKSTKNGHGLPAGMDGDMFFIDIPASTKKSPKIKADQAGLQERGSPSKKARVSFSEG